MKFKKYPSLINHYNLDKYSDIADFMDVQCVATEKIHGANFSVWYDPVLDEICFASRNQFTDSNFQKVGGELLEQLADGIRRLRGLESDIIFYGELCGDGVQKGVKYSPFKQFLVFDVYYNHRFVSHEEGLRLSFAASLRNVPTLCAGTLKELLELSVDIQSEAGADFHSHSENSMEGIVIKPLENMYFASGDRVAIKKKGERWEERSKLPKIQSHNLSDSDSDTLQDLLACVNQNRVHAVLSKDYYTKGDFGKVCGLVYADIIEEGSYSQCPMENEKQIKRRMGKAIALAVRKVLIEGK